MFMTSARGARGPYAKGIAKRAEILDAALTVIAREGYDAATVKRLGEAVGLSQNGLLRYFGSKDALFAEILSRQDEISRIEIDIDSDDFAETLVERLLGAIDDQVAAPGISQLSLRVSGEATAPDHIAHDFIRERYATIRRVIEDAISELQNAGRLAADIDPQAVAALIYASWDGLQIQWMYDSGIDVRDRMTYLVRALRIDVGADRALRRG